MYRHSQVMTKEGRGQSLQNTLNLCLTISLGHMTSARPLVVLPQGHTGHILLGFCFKSCTSLLTYLTAKPLRMLCPDSWGELFHFMNALPQGMVTELKGTCRSNEQTEMSSPSPVPEHGTGHF